MLAERFGWPATVVDQQDPDFIQELLIFVDEKHKWRERHKPIPK